MTDIVWGDPIAVDGERPEWLADEVRILRKDGTHTGNEPWLDYSIRTDGLRAGDLYWGYWVTHIRLPADHFAYTAIAAGFVPWGGGDEAPADATGEVLFRDGRTENYSPKYWRWTWRDDHSDIIGYRRRTEQPAGDTVAIALRTQSEWEDYIKREHSEFYNPMAGMAVLRGLGLVKPEPTEAERIAADTGIALGDVERVLAAR